ncbi:MAG: N-6 DNA methylase [Capnocytophaga ochracea]
MSNFIEHNNRLKAKKLAEYITGKSLRKYIAEKVKKYTGRPTTVFDGACGSGQLEEFIEAKKFIGVDIQEESCGAFCENFPNADVRCQSFFLYDEPTQVDCVVMNPPFSLTFKDLSDEEIAMIQRDFNWKKNGKVDDIFVLKSLKYTKRYAFYILFPGVGYRGTEKIFRELIGNMLLELNLIRNAFDDTNIDVLCIVIDKNKTSDELHREIYDCKTEHIIANDKATILPDVWEVLREKVITEEIDIKALEAQIELIKQKRRAIEDELDLFIETEVKPLLDL